jgi:hypothetical protein
MDYKEFSDLLKEALPINRKERFFTGTVLPSLLFHNGYSNLFTFLQQIEDFPREVNSENTDDNFLFYTEYNLKESAGNKTVGTKIYTATRDTPDVVIQILKPVTLFVVIEAKMFANVIQNDFNRQMNAQKLAIIDVLEDKYPEYKSIHIGLIPAKLGIKSTETYSITYWDNFLNDKKFHLKGNFFLNYLRYALEHYEDLVAAGKAITVQDEKSGSMIMKDFKNKKQYWIGRRGGIKTIIEDVKSSSWRNKNYCINDNKPREGHKGNWITIDEFAHIVKENDK